MVFTSSQQAANWKPRGASNKAAFESRKEQAHDDSASNSQKGVSENISKKRQTNIRGRSTMAELHAARERCLIWCPSPITNRSCTIEALDQVARKKAPAFLSLSIEGVIT